MMVDSLKFSGDQRPSAQESATEAVGMRCQVGCQPSEGSGHVKRAVKTWASGTPNSDSGPSSPVSEMSMFPGIGTWAPGSGGSRSQYVQGSTRAWP